MLLLAVQMAGHSRTPGVDWEQAEMKDNYHRMLLHRNKDKELLVWLESERIAGESSNRAIKRKLYMLCRESLKSAGEKKMKEDKKCQS